MLAAIAACFEELALKAAKVRSLAAALRALGLGGRCRHYGEFVFG